MKRYLSISLVPMILLGSCKSAEPEQSNYLSINSKEELYEFFRYSAERDILVSGHRGGMAAGFPENSIETFANTIRHLGAFFEIDPRLTKDSVIVLMHDETIDRTTTGTGHLSEHTYQELMRFDLVDRDGKVTPYKIPTLGQCIEWSRGKTILNLDLKDVPQDFLSDYIASLAPTPCNLMYTVHNPEQARKYLDKNPDAMLSCWCRSMEEFAAYEKAAIPWRQVLAYVGPRISDENRALCDTLRSRGVMCMISVAPTHDRASSVHEKTTGYKREAAAGPDVIETDFPCLFVTLDLSK